MIKLPLNEILGFNWFKIDSLVLWLITDLTERHHHVYVLFLVPLLAVVNKNLKKQKKIVIGILY